VSTLEAPAGGRTGDAQGAGPGTAEGAGVPTRRRHTARWVAGAVLAVLVVVAVVAATRPAYQAADVASPLVGKEAPAFAGTDLAGHHVSLAQYRGRFVYLNFFASWCPPCQQEEQDLVAFDFQQQRRGAAGAALVSVVFNDSDAAAARFVGQWGAGWPAVPDRDGAVANSYGVGSPPVTFLVDPHGVVVGAWDGPVTVDQLDHMLSEAQRPDG
jgi:cytochrome c biogenesis protein CcmG, thiol:disulfide interchange protein DsbE